MSTYLKVRWRHQYPDEPVLLLSELDANRYEIRKVEVFADGTKGYASEQSSVHGTQLGEVPVPTEEEISTDPQFFIEAVTADEFERLWESALSP
jgi:hypothetical protein